jgi:hypothetical protein
MLRQGLLFLAAWVLVIAVTSVVPHSALAQGTQLLTTWGDPDLNGVWDFRTITPMERPEELADKATLTEEEAAAFAVEASRRADRDLIDSAEGGLLYAAEAEGGVVPYNEFWYDRGANVIGTRRTSLITDPSNGRFPPLTPNGQRHMDEQREIGREEQRGRPVADKPDDRGVGDRCIMGFNAGPPMVPSAYNNNIQLFQTADYVVILNEMVHNARIVPLDGRSHGTIRQWAGDSSGRWDNNTLVVDTTNFRQETSLNGSGSAMHLIERFTRVDADTLNYEVTTENPEIWTSPWTMQVPMSKNQDEIYEYACHEGNYSMATILRGARLEEMAAAEAAR